ncbi:pentatricopeptide repeat-containing protein At4g33170-like [Andrographis paniculata]|uniref:pentatricopeptide repeat-containing protein At4g33170-like n=1 Tax=Andrographis paniculata TaxID=175694 RepID=UPI0021E8F6DE|nr:pentatricopeptide repeat-containing protein At4g33170-like [Andrographis paniculata]
MTTATLVPQLRKQLQHHTSATALSLSLRECAETYSPESRKARTSHAKLVKVGGPGPGGVRSHNHLLNAYARSGGDLNSALQLFEEMPLKNVVSWTLLIAGLVRRAFPLQAVSLFSEMHRSSSSIRPNEYTFVSALQACSSLDSNCASQVYALIIKYGFANNTFLVNAFLTALIRHGMLEAAALLFDGCTHKDIVSWNAMFAGFLKFACQDIPQLWNKMIRQGVQPDEFTYATVLSGLAVLSDLETGLRVHAHLVRSGHGSERCVGNALADMYLKNQRLGDGFRAFEEIPVKDVRSWTQMAAGCLSYGEPVEALGVIAEMRRAAAAAGVGLNEFTLATGLSACASLASLREGEKFHSLAVKLGGGDDVTVNNALLDMYAKCGDMDGALMVFRWMGEHKCDRSVVSWTTMIMGYAQNGQPKEALELFQQMRAGGGEEGAVGGGEEGAVKPNGVTLTCVLHACSQGGYVEEGLRHFRSMRRGEYGVAPGEDHYACVVDLLGRAGRIEEAEQLIMGMPLKPPSAVLWKTLLAACRVHGDMGTAKRAARHALAMDNRDPSICVLLSNTFADFGNWNSVGAVRKRRIKDDDDDDDIKKMPGSSWLLRVH